VSRTVLPSYLEVPREARHESVLLSCQSNAAPTNTVVQTKPPTENSTIRKQAPLAGDKLPFAVIPLDRMSCDHMKQALRDRGIKLPHPPTRINLEIALRKGGYSIEQQTAIQCSKHANYLRMHDLSKLQRDAINIRTKIRNIESKVSSTDLYLSMNVEELKWALGKCNSTLRTTAMRRPELTLLLDSYKYQGGGSANAQLIHLKAAVAPIVKQIEDTKVRIASLSAVSQNYYKKNSRVGEKRPIAKVD